MPHLDIIPDGMLSVGDSDADYIFGDAVNPLDLIPIEDSFIPKFNQRHAMNGEVSSFCTGINPMRAALSLDNKDVGMDFWVEFWEYCKAKYGYVAGKGNTAIKGVDATRNFYNMKFPKTPIISFRVPLLSTDHIKVASKGYKTIVCYNGSTEYNVDYRKDNVLDGDVFGTKTYGHCTLMKTEDLKQKIDDSYDGTPYNVYTIKNLQGLIKSSTFFSPTYFFVRDPKGELYTKQMLYEDEKKAAIAWAKANGISNGDGLSGDDYRHLVWLYRYSKI